MPTADAARQLGIAARTLQRGVADGLIEPDLVSIGGHARWDVARLRAELRSFRERDDGGTE